MNFACHGNVIEISWISAGGQQQLWESRGISIRSSCRSHVGDPGSTGQPGDLQVADLARGGEKGMEFHGSRMVFMEFAWFVFMDFQWLSMDLQWLSHGFAMVVPWISNGCPMDFQWLTHGFAMVVPWISNGCPMDLQWLSHGLPMVVPWISNGGPMDFQWLSHGICNDFQWLCHAFAMIVP